MKNFMGGITVDKRKPCTLDISNKIRISFSKEFAKANYNYETYLHNIIEQAIRDWWELKQWVKQMMEETGDDVPRYTYEKVLDKMDEIENR